MNKDILYWRLSVLSEQILHYFTLHEVEKDEEAGEIILEVQKEIYNIQNELKKSYDFNNVTHIRGN
jgi:hypothetical protein